MSARRILIIEDDKSLQELLLAFFRPKGFEVVCLDDAESALTELIAAPSQFDAVVTDLMLPHVSGIEFTRRARREGIDCPILLMTVERSVELAIEAIEAGADDFVVKPLNFPHVLVSVEKAIHFAKIKKEHFSLKTAYQIQSGSQVRNVVARSAGFCQALDLARRVAGSSISVLISGESGTGKEVIAKAIHSMGDRSKGPFVAINCSAIPENLLESELFGHAKGSFTGASEKKVGLFEEAEGGTLFLDEIGDMSLMLQAKLLRVLQDRKIRRIGENQLRAIDVRVISATHKDLKQEVENKTFREDLFYRLNVVQIRIPPLRERAEDIPALAEFFLHKFAALNESKVRGFSKSALDKLLAYSWPGNVRELENAIERAVVLSSHERIEAEDLIDLEGEVSTTSSRATSTEDRVLTLDELVRSHIRHVLRINKGAKEKTARDLNIDRKTLYRKLQEMDL